MDREPLAKGLRGARRAAALLASEARIASLKARYPGFHTEGSVFVGPGCDIYVAAGSTLWLRSCSLHRDVTLETAAGAILDLRCFRVGRGVVIIARERIDFGPDGGIAEYAVIRDADHIRGLPLDEPHFTTAPVVIGRGVFIGAQSTVLAGVTIGADAVVAAGAVVTKDVAAATVVAGVPARPIQP